MPRPTALRVAQKPAALSHYFSPCPRGLEATLSAELTVLGATEVKAVEGGVGFSGDLRLCYRVNLESRIASRVLWRLGEWPYQREEDIYKRVAALRWGDHFDAHLTLRVNVSAIASPLKSLDFITLRIKDAVCDRFRADTGSRPSVDTEHPDVRIHAFFEADRFTLYLDTSGDPLFKRGWRKSAGDAPVRENLAAGILALTGWQPGTPLLDPMCGSGTLLIEAAMIAARIAPGAARSFGFEKLRNYDAGLWQSTLTAARAMQVPPPETPSLFGADLYGEQLKLARINLASAGLSEAVVLKQANVLELLAPARAGLMITNPPYGVRVGEQQELAQFYPKLGDALKAKYAGWAAWIFTGDLRLPKLIGLKPSRRIPLYNGALECRLYSFDIVAGAMRRQTASSAPGEAADRQ